MRLRRRIVLLGLRAARREGLSPRVYSLLLAEIFSSFSGYLMMSAAGLIFAVYAIVQNHSLFWVATFSAMLIVSLLRIVLFARYHAAKSSGSAKAGVTASFEAAFAALAIAMSALIGASIFFFVASDRPQNVVCALILSMGIAGGVSGRNGSRPKIAIAQVAIIIAPLIAALAVGSLAFRTVSCSLLMIFMLASYLSIQAFYKSLKTSYQNEHKVVVLATRLKKSADLFQVALDNMTSGLLLFSPERRVLIANEKVRELLGSHIVDKMVGRTTVEFHTEVFDDLGMDAVEAITLKEEFGRIMLGKSEGRALLVDHKRDRSFELRMMPVPDHGAVMSVEDVTEKREKERVIHRLAHYDHLTDLANRLTFEEVLKSKLSADVGDVFVCYLDLDGFKSINDELGHLAGDQLLKIVAQRIKQALGEGGFAARLAGDEFALILDAGGGASGAASSIEAVLDAIAERAEIGGRLVKVTASAGIVSARMASFDAETALRSADTALYEAKKAGGGVHLWFDEQMHTKAGHLKVLTAYLELALENSQLTLEYQPIVDFRSGRMVACEALSRWKHPALGDISPGEFIPLAESTGLIHKLGRWALQQACRDILAWGADAVPIAVNVSPLQFHGEQICAVVEDILLSSGVDPSMLEIEITESAIAADPEKMRSGLERLASIGVTIALDDFGTGYSSLSLLHSLPISKIKLDRSFVLSIETDPARVRLISSIVQMAQVMRKQLVIEGIETQREFLAIVDAQARFVQGYYFARPLPFDAVRHFHAACSPGRDLLPTIGEDEELSIDAAQTPRQRWLS